VGWQLGLARELRLLQAGCPLPATSVQPLMARSGNATPLAPAPGTPPQSLHQGLVQVSWDVDGVGL
jgi:hypothetical protein